MQGLLLLHWKLKLVHWLRIYHLVASFGRGLKLWLESGFETPITWESIEMLRLHNCPCQKSKQIKIRRYEILWVFLCQNPLSLKANNDEWIMIKKEVKSIKCQVYSIQLSLKTLSQKNFFWSDVLNSIWRIPFWDTMKQKIST